MFKLKTVEFNCFLRREDGERERERQRERERERERKKEKAV